MRTRDRALGYRPEFDGFRALAILGVLVFHTQLTWFQRLRVDGGLLGVDLFFVLSGFLITTLLVEEYAARGRIDRATFYARRALRLLPALVLALILGAVVASVYGNGVGRLRYPHAAVAVLLFSGNFFGNKLGVLTPMWSLGLEEQYYLLWPVVLLVALRRNVRVERLAVFTAGAAICMAGLRSGIYHALGPKTSWIEFALHSWGRADGVLLGTSLALVLASPKAVLVRQLLRDRTLAFAAVVCTAGLLIHAALLNAATYDTILLLDFCFAILVGHAYADQSSAICRTVGAQPLVAIGRISYGLYIFHWPIFSFFKHYEGSALSTAALAWGALFALAIASYFVVELPALKLKSLLGSRRRTPARRLRAVPARMPAPRAMTQRTAA